MIALEHSKDGRIATVLLNRPDRKNALDVSLVTELTSVIKSLGADNRVRVIVITGAGSVFSAGADLAALKTLQDASYESNLADSALLGALFETMIASPKVLIARVNGHAIAGGSGLVAACDISFASNTAKFGFSEVRIGFVPALVSVLLRNKISSTSLRNILLTGSLFSANEAKEMGLITAVTNPEALEYEVLNFAESICRNTSMEAIAQTKRLLHNIEGTDFAEALQIAVVANAQARSTQDCKDGVRSFLEKKSAPWMQDFDADHPSRA